MKILYGDLIRIQYKDEFLIYYYLLLIIFALNVRTILYVQL